MDNLFNDFLHTVFVTTGIIFFTGAGVVVWGYIIDLLKAEKKGATQKEIKLKETT